MLRVCDRTTFNQIQKCEFVVMIKLIARDFQLNCFVLFDHFHLNGLTTINRHLKMCENTLKKEKHFKLVTPWWWWWQQATTKTTAVAEANDRDQMSDYQFNFEKGYSHGRDLMI